MLNTTFRHLCWLRTCENYILFPIQPLHPVSLDWLLGMPIFAAIRHSNNRNRLATNSSFHTMQNPGIIKTGFIKRNFKASAKVGIYCLKRKLFRFCQCGYEHIRSYHEHTMSSPWGNVILVRSPKYKGMSVTFTRNHLLDIKFAAVSVTPRQPEW